MQQQKIGGSVIPFCTRDKQVLFLFHTTFSGRRAGHLIDFGGKAEQGEDHQQAAMREFIEETETMWFADDLEEAKITQSRVQQQMALLQPHFDNALAEHPNWHCKRIDPKTGGYKDWITYFVEFEHKELHDMNNAWRKDLGERFKKRRELFWVPGNELLDVCTHKPSRLWRRLRQLENLPGKIASIIDRS